MSACSCTQRRPSNISVTNLQRRSNGRPLPLLLTLFLFTLLSTQFFSPASANRGYGFTPYDYGKQFFGEGTYYGLTSGGNCAMGSQSALPYMYQKMIPVAINDDQYDNSKSCGACIQVRGSGRGIGGRPIRGTFRAYVHDRCPECRRGDLDLSSSGDGRWHISWKFVACPMNDAFFAFEGSNNFYKKIQVRGLRFPARAMWINGKKAERSQDNFFIAHGWFPYSGSIRVIDVRGNVFRAWTNLNLATGVFRAPASFNTPAGAGSSYKKPYRRPYYSSTPKKKYNRYRKHGGGGGKKQYYKPKPKPQPKPKPRTCVADWMACTGKSNSKGLPCCGWRKGYKCKYVGWSIFRHCLP